MLNQIDFYKLINSANFDKEFALFSTPVVEMYWFKLFISKTKTKNLQKLNIYIGDDEDISKINGVKTVYIKFDFTIFDSLGVKDKKIMILDTIHKVFLSISDEFDIDKNKLHQAYDYCIEHNLENRWLLGGIQLSHQVKNTTEPLNAIGK